MIVDTNTSKKRIEMFGKLFSYYLEANIAITYVLLKFICTDSRDVFFPHLSCHRFKIIDVSLLL